MKIEFNLDDDVPLNKMMDIPSMTIVVTGVFHENKYDPQVFQMNVCIKCKIQKWKVKMTLLILIFY